eukprot:TRINITY_DN8570_c0_g1_i1.p1 TRINITY_DN8570_c0_g1~~TRINITY_DN8570_c0_g1_i1.p1  ORF type:complete len:638 (+),score=47.08 TRINITY_DN8570_c0_g1_i1:226-2139(+)
MEKITPKGCTSHYARIIRNAVLFVSLVVVAGTKSPCHMLQDAVKAGTYRPFCPIQTGASCCSQDLDEILALRFERFGVNVTNHPECAQILQSFLCHECYPLGTASKASAAPSSTALPYLCEGEACEAVYSACRDVRLAGVGASTSLRGQGVLGEEFPTLQAFTKGVCKPASSPECMKSFARGDSLDLSWHPSLQTQLKKAAKELEPAGASNLRRSLASTPGLCFERLTTNAYITLWGHPVNSNYVVVANQAGLLNIASVGAVGSKTGLREVKTYLNLTARVLDKGERGFLSFAFHPNFKVNGRLFVSYICDGNVHADCQGPCMCTPANGCTLGELKATCNGNTIIAEYNVRNPSRVSSVPSLKETRRLFTYGRPYTNHNGGDIFFGLNGYLYITSGDGGYFGDPFNMSQNGKTFLGKILRVDVDNIPKGRAYGIPGTNPYQNVSGIRPEVYALGLRNPWRCSVDTTLGTLICGDVGQDKVEEVDIILSGHNYGWHFFEGTTVYLNGAPAHPIGGSFTKPIFEYSHPNVDITGIPKGGNAITGGFVYRAARNSCLKGKYIYGDSGGGEMYVGTIYPSRGSSPSTVAVPYKCAPTSPVADCRFPLGAWGFGTDGNQELYATSYSGVYRVTNGALCGYSC